jgi:hypothetical protein
MNHASPGLAFAGSGTHLSPSSCRQSVCAGGHDRSGVEAHPQHTAANTIIPTNVNQVLIATPLLAVSAPMPHIRSHRGPAHSLGQR